MRELDRKRRNRCALSALALYVLTNVVGLATLRSPSSFAFHYGFYFALGWSLIGVVLVGLLIAFSCLGARARGHSGWAGLPIALVGLLLWFGIAVYLLYQNVNVPFGLDNPARVGDDRLRLLLPVAWGVAALLVRALPRRDLTPAAVSNARG